MPPARRDAKPSSTSAPAPAAPPYYIATAPLFIGKFGRAHNPGDQVLAEHVDRYGWQHLVRPPDGYTLPDKTPSEPETGTGQATSSKEGE